MHNFLVLLLLVDLVKAADAAAACSHRRKPVVNAIKNKAAIAAAEMGNRFQPKVAALAK